MEVLGIIDRGQEAIMEILAKECRMRKTCFRLGLLPLLAAGVPVIALSQAWDVVRRSQAAQHNTAIPPRSLLIERADFRFQRLVSGTVLVPCFEPGAAGNGRVIEVPLIVREEFTAVAGPARTQVPLYVLTGGSGVGSSALTDYAGRYGLPVIGSLPEPSTVLDEEGIPLIDRAAAVLVQGGLSSISECIARGKRMIVLPIESHGEQLSNALEVERLGLGMRVSQLSEPPGPLLERLERTPRAAAGTSLPGTDGAQVVAGILLKKLGLGSAPRAAGAPGVI